MWPVRLAMNGVIPIAQPATKPESLYVDNVTAQENMTVATAMAMDSSTAQPAKMVWLSTPAALVTKEKSIAMAVMGMALTFPSLAVKVKNVISVTARVRKLAWFAGGVIGKWVHARSATTEAFLAKLVRHKKSLHVHGVISMAK